jgi:uncharacterized protein YbjT (DUF2867 family)
MKLVVIGGSGLIGSKLVNEGGTKHTGLSSQGRIRATIDEGRNRHGWTSRRTESRFN